MIFKYQDIANNLELQILQMQSGGRRKLPTEQELCKTYSCSRQTVRAALDILEYEGLITRRQGSGAYLSDSPMNRSNTILFLTEDQDEYIYPDLIAQLRNLLSGMSFNLSCRSTGGTITKEREALADALQDLPAAIIIEPIRDAIPNPNLPLIEELHDRGVPIVYLYSAYPLPKDAIVIKEDNQDGATMLVCHLANRGHRKISGIFCADDSRGLSRYQGCMRACQDIGVPFDEDAYYLFTSSEMKKLRQGDPSLLNRYIENCLSDKTAIICQNDIIAHQLIDLLEKKGYSVPEDIAVASFDNSYYANTGHTRITSLGHQERAVSSALAQSVIAAVSRRAVPKTHLPWQLHIRTSG